MLDPYVGSGTTAVAAKLLGHRYIGIDNSQTYLDMAKARIQQSETERHKIEAEQAEPGIKTTFKERKAQGKHVGQHRVIA